MDPTWAPPRATYWRRAQTGSGTPPPKPDLWNRSVPGPSPYPGTGPICRIAPPSSPTPPHAPRTDRFYTSARPLRGRPPDSTDCLLNCRGKGRPRKLDLPRNTPKSHLIGHKSSLWYCFCTRIPKIAVPRPKSFIFVAFLLQMLKMRLFVPKVRKPQNLSAPRH